MYSYTKDKVATMQSEPVNCLLIAAGKYHDIDFARARLLSALAEHPVIRTRIREDYEDKESLNWANVLISYTCDVIPSEPMQQLNLIPSKIFVLIMIW